MIQERLNKISALIDYKIGDWVETCAMLPGIISEINNRYNFKQQYFIDNVVVFYPDKNESGMCSINHCGVHKISEEYAKILFEIGEDVLKTLYNTYINSSNKEWEDTVIEYFKSNNMTVSMKALELFNIGETFKHKLI